MAEVVLKLVIDPVTGSRDLVVDYLSDDDALPVEHEQEHRALLDKLIEGSPQEQGLELDRGEAAPVAEQQEVITQEQEGRREKA